MILSAGLGTRLLPHTNILPKPLFTISGAPLLHLIIQALQDHGFTDIAVNTHHLHTQVEQFLEKQHYKNHVLTRYEPEILETGGAIKNLSDFFGPDPFIVINCDIFTDINLSDVYRYHLSHHHPVTMVMHDYKKFNNVRVNNDGCVEAFRQKKSSTGKLMAFTGIHVIDPLVLEYIPTDQPYSIIDAYSSMLESGHKIKSYPAKNHVWRDIGTPEEYTRTATIQMARKAFSSRFNHAENEDVDLTLLKGDGSDRKWSRILSKGKSLVMVEHGIRTKKELSEIDSFITIGNHLHRREIPVPEIILSDNFSGIAILEDLGDIHLQQYVKNLDDDEKIMTCYKTIIDMLIRFSTDGAVEFQPSFCYQTQKYDREMILTSECRYFVEAFLVNYLGQKTGLNAFKDEFDDLSQKALTGAVVGLMHRDMQSRNIMVKDGNFFFIDFQGARMGPIQYDIASLLIDPYVKLPESIQDRLLDYSIASLSAKTKSDIDAESFRNCYRHVCLTRNLQMLGAFGFLTKVKQKKDFEVYIPTAVNTLHNNLNRMQPSTFPILKKMVDQISKLV